MSIGNTTLWGDVLPGGVEDEESTGNLDVGTVIDELLPTLHAGSRSELSGTGLPWTVDNLVVWADEALKHLARVASVFVGRSASRLTAPGQATYSLPDRHISTLHVSYGTTALRPANTAELEARDESFRTTPGTPTDWYEDLLGSATVGLAKVPTDEVNLPIIYEGYPEPLDAEEQTLIAAPAPIKGYLAMSILAEAYGRESEMEMPDVAAHCRERCRMYETLFQSYYGGGV